VTLGTCYSVWTTVWYAGVSFHSAYLTVTHTGWQILSVT